MATNILNIPELLKRARGYNPGLGPNPGAPLPQSQDPGLPPVASPPGTGDSRELPFRLQDTLRDSVQAPPQPSARDQALSQYRQAMQEQAPSQADYHPSVGHRIIGALLGGASAFDPNFKSKNPMSQLGHDEVYGPYDKSVNDYQKRLAQKKEAYETESSAESQEAKVGELNEQKKAEVARAGAEESREAVNKYKISPEGQKAELEKLKVQHPGTPKTPGVFKVTLNNGEGILATEKIGRASCRERE